VRHLYLAAAGTKPRLPERMELIRKRVKTEPDITRHLIQGIAELKNTPYIMASFEDGRKVVGIPNKNDPENIELSESEGAGPVKPRSQKVQLSKDVLPPVKLLIPILTLSNPWLPSRGVRWT
jgi:hypothetical protein